MISLRIIQTAIAIGLVAGGSVVACSSSSANPSGNGPSSNNTNNNTDGGSCCGKYVGDGAVLAITPNCVGATDNATTVSGLPNVAGFNNVKACVVGDAVNVTFDPLENATDYRIYPMPAAGDVTTANDGTVSIKNAIYRCAGHREALYMLKDIVSPQDGWNDNSAGGATLQNGTIEGFMRSENDATLGYVYPSPGDGRVPVYVLGDGSPALGNAYRAQFNSSRPKIYTTDEKQRDALIAAGDRDDGIAFYVPGAAGPDTRPIYEGGFGDKMADKLQWIDGPEGTARGAGTTIFNALTTAAAGTIPLIRIHVLPYGIAEHDELVGGNARYAKVRTEGDQPITALRWSGITKDSVLVIEALDQGCPWQGALSPQHEDAFTETFGSSVLPYDAYTTIDDMHKALPSGEVFINGQYDSPPTPKAVARTFLKITPALPKMDFYETFADSENFRAAFADPPADNNVYGFHYVAPNFEFSSYDNSHVHFGTMLGEFWVSYNDIAADVNGKVRLTPKAQGTMSADSFLHVTSEFDVVSTGRRYPQIFISDQGAPLQDNLPKGTTMLIQPKDFSPSLIEIQFCDHRTWDVNNQCPMIKTFVNDFPTNAPLPGESTGSNNTIKFDVFASTNRVYVLLDDKPYACADLPSKADDGNSYHPPSGNVSVTWGDVLYHSGVDFATGGGDITGNSYLFHRTHLHTRALRHLDNFGFTSGSPPPAWDEKVYPCTTGK